MNESIVNIDSKTKQNLSIIKRFNPNWIIVEYNPWSIIFIQLIFFMKIYKIVIIFNSFYKFY